MKVALTSLAALALAGCTASVTGEPFGKKFGSATSVARRGTNSINSSYTILISSGPSDCDTAQDPARPDPDGTQYLQVVIAKNGSELPLSRGEPYVQSGRDEFSTLYGCEVTAGRCQLAAFGGSSVTLTNATDAKVAGSFEATFGTDGKFSGSFDASLCP